MYNFSFLDLFEGNDAIIEKITKLEATKLQAFLYSFANMIDDIGIDYEKVERKRRENYAYLHKRLGGMNQLNVKNAAFMYPLMVENGAAIRKMLQAKKIFIPTLWPTVFEVAAPNEMEYKMAENILPLPVDQRYGIEDMEYIVQEVLKCIS